MYDYQSKVNKKFKKLFKKLRKKMRNTNNAKVVEVIQEFVVKFDENKRCKLPWVTSEINDASKCFIDHIEFLVNNC